MKPYMHFLLGLVSGIAVYHMYCMILAYPSYRARIEAAKEIE